MHLVGVAELGVVHPLIVLAFGDCGAGVHVRPRACGAVRPEGRSQRSVAREREAVVKGEVRRHDLDRSVVITLHLHFQAHVPEVLAPSSGHSRALHRRPCLAQDRRSCGPARSRRSPEVAHAMVFCVATARMAHHRACRALAVALRSGAGAVAALPWASWRTKSKLASLHRPPTSLARTTRRTWWGWQSSV